MSRKERKERKKEIDERFNELVDKQMELLEKNNIWGIDPDDEEYDEIKVKKFLKTKDGQEYLKIEKELDSLNAEKWDLFFN